MRLKFDYLEPGLQKETSHKVIAVNRGCIALEIIYVNRADREIVLYDKNQFSVCTADQFDHRGYEVIDQ